MNGAMPLLYRILIRLGVAWIALVAAGTVIGLVAAESGQHLIVLGVGSLIASLAIIAFALAWVFKPPS